MGDSMNGEQSILLQGACLGALLGWYIGFLVIIIIRELNL